MIDLIRNIIHWVMIFVIAGIIALCVRGCEEARGEGGLMWEGIVIHHNASEYGTIEAIDRYHKSIGWDGIGYHYVIYQDGSVHKGRDINKIGAHAKTGRLYSRNKTHIGICLIGDEIFTSKQIMSVQRLCKQLCKQYPIKSIEEHHEKCPGKGINVKKVLAIYNAKKE